MKTSDFAFSRLFTVACGAVTAIGVHMADPTKSKWNASGWGVAAYSAAETAVLFSKHKSESWALRELEKLAENDRQR